jgi:hypothetical protein
MSGNFSSSSETSRAGSPLVDRHLRLGTEWLYVSLLAQIQQDLLGGLIGRKIGCVDDDFC